MAVALWAWRPVGSRLAALGLLGLWLIGGGILLGHEAFYTRLDVAGARTLSPDALAAAAGIDGLHIFWVNPEEAAAAVRQRFPSLESAEVRCRWPALCTLFVVEGQAPWEWISGDLRLILDGEGRVIEGGTVQAVGAWRSTACRLRHPAAGGPRVVGPHAGAVPGLPGSLCLPLRGRSRVLLRRSRRLDRMAGGVRLDVRPGGSLAGAAIRSGRPASRPGISRPACPGSAGRRFSG
jgi:hypothetical protein